MRVGESGGAVVTDGWLEALCAGAVGEIPLIFFSPHTAPHHPDECSALGSAAKDLESWDGPSVSAMLASSAIIDGGTGFAAAAAAATGVGCDKSSWGGDSASTKSSATLQALAGGVDNPVPASAPPTQADCCR